MPTPTIIPTAALQECAVYAYRTGLTGPWNTFYEAAMKKIAGNSSGVSGGNSSGTRSRSSSTRTRARARAATGSKTVRRRGRPVSGAPRRTTATTSGKANTNDLIEAVSGWPGITMPQLAAEFPGVKPNILGRLIAGAMKQTKMRGPAIKKEGDGYYLAPGYQPPASLAA